MRDEGLYGEILMTVVQNSIRTRKESINTKKCLMHGEIRVKRSMII